MLRSNLGKGGSLILGDYTRANHKELRDDLSHMTIWTG
jgi:hypothetical protein